MVQLKVELPTWLLKPLTGYNPNMVQLKETSTSSNRSMDKVFQSQVGTIKRIKGLTFYSWKDTLPSQHGTIKSYYESVRYFQYLKFQFQHGAIKSGFSMWGVQDIV